MPIFGNILTIVFLYFFLFTTLSTAHIISLKLRNDNRHMIPFSDFEFSNVGYVSLVISSVNVTSTSTSSWPDPSRIGFFLQSREPIDQQPFDFQQYTAICALNFNSSRGRDWFWDEEIGSQEGREEGNKPLEVTEAPEGQLWLFSTKGKNPPEKPSRRFRFRLRPTSLLFTFQNLSHDPQFSVNKSWPVTYSGLKSLFFFNCNNESSLTMEVRAELYNMDDDTTKNYLSLGLTELPFLCFIFSCIYLSFIVVWILVCFKNRRSFNRTHLLMGVLLIMNIVYFMCVSADIRHVKVTGNPDGWDLLFNIFKAMRAVLLFTVITLIGAGWLFWKPVLEGMDKWFLISVILLQVWANLDPVLPWEAAVPYNKSDVPIVDLLSCRAIFFPMWWSHMFLEEIYDTDLNAARNFRKLWVVIGFVVLYVTITRQLSALLLTRWANYVGKETSLLVLCVVMFYLFRPVDRKRLNEFYSPV